jgi:hypothetical protein
MVSVGFRKVLPEDSKAGSVGRPEGFLRPLPRLEDYLARQLKNTSSAEGARHLLDARDGTETAWIDEA